MRTRFDQRNCRAPRRAARGREGEGRGEAAVFRKLPRRVFAQTRASRDAKGGKGEASERHNPIRRAGRVDDIGATRRRVASREEGERLAGFECRKGDNERRSRGAPRVAVKPAKRKAFL